MTTFFQRYLSTLLDATPTPYPLLYDILATYGYILETQGRNQNNYGYELSKEAARIAKEFNTEYTLINDAFGYLDIDQGQRELFEKYSDKEILLITIEAARAVRETIEATK